MRRDVWSARERPQPVRDQETHILIEEETNAHAPKYFKPYVSDKEEDLESQSPSSGNECDNERSESGSPSRNSPHEQAHLHQEHEDSPMRSQVEASDDADEEDNSELSAEEAIGDELLFQAVVDYIDDSDDPDQHNDDDDHRPAEFDSSDEIDGFQHGDPSSSDPYDSTPSQRSNFSRSSTPENDSSTVNYRDPRGACSKKDFATLAHHNIRIRTKISREADAALRLFNKAIGKRRVKLAEIRNRRAMDKGLELGLDEENLREVLRIAIGNGASEELYAAEVRTARKIITRITGITVVHVDRCPNNCRAFEMDEVQKGKQPTLICNHCGASRYKVGNTLAHLKCFLY